MSPEIEGWMTVLEEGTGMSREECFVPVAKDLIELISNVMHASLASFLAGRGKDASGYPPEFHLLTLLNSGAVRKTDDGTFEMHIAILSAAAAMIKREATKG